MVADTDKLPVLAVWKGRERARSPGERCSEHAAVAQPENRRKTAAVAESASGNVQLAN